MRFPSSTVKGLSSWLRVVCLVVLPLLFFCACSRQMLDDRPDTKPAMEDMVGTWVPNAATLHDMEENGHYKITTHELVLKANGTYEANNMPNWWKTAVGESSGTYDSETGTWKLQKKDGDWVVYLISAVKYGMPLDILSDQPPYRLRIWLGDPDGGHRMIFEKKTN